MMDDEPPQTKFNYNHTATAQNQIFKMNRRDTQAFNWPLTTIARVNKSKKWHTNQKNTKPSDYIQLFIQ